MLIKDVGNIELSSKLLGSALSRERLAIKLLEEASTGKEEANALNGTELTGAKLEEESKGKVATKELEDKGKLMEAAKLLKAAKLAAGKAKLLKLLAISVELEAKGNEVEVKEAKLEAEIKLLKDSARELVLKAALVKELLLKAMDKGNKEKGKLLENTALLSNRLPKLVRGSPEELLGNATLKSNGLNALEERLKMLPTLSKGTKKDRLLLLKGALKEEDTAGTLLDKAEGILIKALLTKLGGTKALGTELLKLGKESAIEEEESGKLTGTERLLNSAGRPVNELLKAVDKAPKLLGIELEGNNEGTKKEGILEETLGKEEAALLLAKGKLIKADSPKLLAGKELNPALSKELLAGIADSMPKLLLGPELKLDNEAKEKGNPLELREEAASKDELIAKGNRVEEDRLLGKAKIELETALGTRAETRGNKIEGKLANGSKLEELLNADTKLGREERVDKDARDSINGILAKELLKGRLLTAPLLDKVTALNKDRLAKGNPKPALEDKGILLLKEGSDKSELKSAGGRLLIPKKDEGILATKLEETAGAETNRGENKELLKAPKLRAGKDKLLLKSGKDKDKGLKKEIGDKLLLTGIKLALIMLKVESAKLPFKSVLKLLLKAKGKLLKALLKNGPEDRLLAKAIGALKLLPSKLGNESATELSALLKGKEARLLERIDKLLFIGPDRLTELAGREEIVLKAPTLEGKEAKTVLSDARLTGITPPAEEEALGKILDNNDKFSAKLNQEGKEPSKLLLAATALKLRKANEEAELKEGKADDTAKLVKATLEEDQIGKEGTLLKLTGNRDEDDKGAKIELGIAENKGAEEVLSKLKGAITSLGRRAPRTQPGSPATRGGFDISANCGKSGW